MGDSDTYAGRDFPGFNRKNAFVRTCTNVQSRLSLEYGGLKVKISIYGFDSREREKKRNSYIDILCTVAVTIYWATAAQGYN